MNRCSYGETVSIIAKFMEKKVEKERFAVCRFSCADGSNIPLDMSGCSVLYEAVGNYQVPACLNTLVEMTGEWTRNTFNSRGRQKTTTQFKVQYLYPILPRTEEESVVFLHGIQGIGLKTARAIITKFGTIDNALAQQDIMIATIKAMTLSRVKRVQAEVASVSAVKDMIAMLSKVGINNLSIAKIAETYGASSLEMVKNHPYDMVKTVSFSECDKIALSEGKNAKAPERLNAAIMESVMTIRGLRNAIIVDGQAVIDTAIQKCNMNDNGAASEKDIRDEMKTMLTGENPTLACTKHYLYVRDDYEAECDLAKKFADLGAEIPDAKIASCYEAAFDKWKKLNKNIGLAPAQEDAVTAAANRVSVVTGGPGTGKTTVLKAIIETYMMAFPNSPVTLMAPTGLAAKRMSDSCAMRALTVHKAFKLKPADNVSGFVASEDSGIQGGLVICDEFSMVPLHLARFIINGVAIREDTRIVFVGDIDQLPPVSPGAVLEALIRSGEVKVTRLTKNFRQEAGSTIIDLAYAINEGRPQDIHYDGSVVLKPIHEDDATQEATEILEKLKEEFVASCGKFGLENTFVLSPTHRQSKLHPEYCLYADNVNIVLRDAVNPRKMGEFLEHGGREFRIGDRVINLRNQDDCINGDIGIVKNIDSNEKTLLVDFNDGNTVTFEQEHIKDLELAYCISVHKSQGCEFKSVIMPASRTQRNMMSRKLVYTAVTRAKVQLLFVGDERVIANAASSITESEKKDFLGARIMKFAKTVKVAT